MRKNLHPGAKWLFRLTGLVVGLIFSFFLNWIVFLPVRIAFLGKVSYTSGIGATLATAAVFILFGILFILIIAEIYARMSYNRWFYEFTSDQLRLERGIIWKKYSNIPYERIQNVDITRGIIARLCGFSTLNIQTAGYHYTGKGIPRSEGYIPAVSIEEAEQIREFLIKKISKRSKGGL